MTEADDRSLCERAIKMVHRFDDPPPVVEQVYRAAEEVYVVRLTYFRYDGAVDGNADVYLSQSTSFERVVYGDVGALSLQDFPELDNLITRHPAFDAEKDKVVGYCVRRQSLVEVWTRPITPFTPGSRKQFQCHKRGDLFELMDEYWEIG